MTQLPTFDRTELETNIASLGLDNETYQEYLLIADLVFRGTSNDMRASKPKVGKRTAHLADRYGKAAYVWRMIGFTVARSGPLQCMPVCATFDLPATGPDGRWSSSAAREMSKDLDRLVDCFVNCLPKSEWHGVNRWGRALGYF